MKGQEMKVTTSIENGVATIRLQGQFDYRSHRKLLDASIRLIAIESVTALRVDLSEVDYVDSAGLGTLLVTRETVKREGKAISLDGARGQTKQTLEMAQFPRLFATE